MKLVKYSEKNANIGDIMQTIALMDFVEKKYGVKITNFEDRSLMTENDMIINGWHRHRKEKLPNNALYIGLHSDRLMMKNICENTLIGCRDKFTMLEVDNLPHLKSIFTGCSTCTIPVYNGPRKGKSVYMHEDKETGIIPLDEQIIIARNLLDELKQKELVTTNRLHIALPCIALGTPVKILKREFQPERFSIFENVPSHLFPGFDKIVNYEPSGLRDYLEHQFIKGFDSIVHNSSNFQSFLSKNRR
jgi:hypothetical protein